jgi:hypothetical protein
MTRTSYIHSVPYRTVWQGSPHDAEIFPGSWPCEALFRRHEDHDMLAPEGVFPIQAR